MWICPFPNGHIQAVGTDAAGRRQYRYHDDWRVQRDAEKHRPGADVRPPSAGGPRAGRPRPRRARPHPPTGAGRGVPAARPRLLPDRRRVVRRGERHLRAGHDAPRARDGDRRPGRLRLHGQERQAPRPGDRRRQRPQGRAIRCSTATTRARSCSPTRTATGGTTSRARTSTPTCARCVGEDVSAKDFRTWHATVLTAVGLAVSTRAPTSESARKTGRQPGRDRGRRSTSATPRRCAGRSYIDPRVIDLYDDGVDDRRCARTSRRRGRLRSARHARAGRGRRAAPAAPAGARGGAGARATRGLAELGGERGDSQRRPRLVPRVRPGRCPASGTTCHTVSDPWSARRATMRTEPPVDSGTRRLSTMLAITRSCTVSGSRPGSVEGDPAGGAGTGDRVDREDALLVVPLCVRDVGPRRASVGAHQRAAGGDHPAAVAGSGRSRCTRSPGCRSRAARASSGRRVARRSFTGARLRNRDPAQVPR